MKVCHDFRETMMSPNIWEPFRGLAFELEIEIDMRSEKRGLSAFIRGGKGERKRGISGDVVR
jgi:hypothetical protein